MIERRKEKRYAVPEIYREYVTFKLRQEPGEFVPMDLLDFSPSGIRIRSPFKFSVNSVIECLIAVPKSLTMEIPFVGKIKYCVQEEPNGDYLIGAEIIQTSDKIGFDPLLQLPDCPH